MLMVKTNRMMIVPLTMIMFLNVGAWLLLEGGVVSKFFESQVSDNVSCAEVLNTC